MIKGVLNIESQSSVETGGEISDHPVLEPLEPRIFLLLYKHPLSHRRAIPFPVEIQVFSADGGGPLIGGA